MEDEIEKLYLLDKLNELIKQVDQSKKPFPSKIAKLPSKIQRLKNILEKELNNTTTLLTREKLYNLNNLLSEWLSKQHSPLSFESVVFALNLESILEEIQNVDSNNPDRRSQSSQSHPHINAAQGETRRDIYPVEAYRWSNQYVDEKNIFGIKDKVVFLKRLILDQPPEENLVVFRGFGLVGMRGIGKTTLAQMVFNHPDIRNHFLPRLWVCVSKQPGDDPDPKKEIVKRVLRSLGVEDEIITYTDINHQLKGLLYSLRQHLSGKRYLIVLDDVCIEDTKYLDFISDLEKNIVKFEEKMAFGLPKDCGGTIIVTSREKEIARLVVGEKNLHRVLPLSDDNCWDIFKNTYEENGNLVNNDMESLKKKITEKCHGLPLAAKMMGDIARKPRILPSTT